MTLEIGSLGNDVLNGTSLDDTLRGRNGDDRLFGLSGQDTLNGGTGADVAYGGDGDDQLRGGDAVDSLFGGSGRDLLDGQAGDDEMAGGSGNDTYRVADLGDKISENVGEGHDTVWAQIDFSLSDAAGEVEVIRLMTGQAGITASGNNTDNSLYGNEVDNALFGGDGNDRLDGGSGSDTMTGGAGDDTFIVDTAGDVIVEQAGGGADRVFVSAAVFQNAANVELVTSEQDGQARALFGGSHGETLIGNTAENELVGNSGDDVLYGGQGADSIYGGAGDDLIETRKGDDTAFGGEGNDTLRSSSGNAQLFGDDGDDTLLGRSGIDSVDGGSGSDLVVGGLGPQDDIMTGGSGNDTLFVDGGESLVEAADGGIDLVWAATDWTLGANLENFKALAGELDIDGVGNELANSLQGNSGANSLSGGSGRDAIRGHQGDDVLFGGSGRDFLNGQGGDDEMHGGAGNDTFIVRESGDQVFEGVGEGNDTVRADIDFSLSDAAGEVENIFLMYGQGDLTASGNNTKNRLFGNEGNNQLFGGDGNDRIDGGSGGDTMTGGAGKDTFFVDTATDVIVEDVAGGKDRVIVSTTVFDNFDNVELVISTKDGVGRTLFGSSGDEKIIGNTGDNHLAGNSGNDIIFGGEGADSIYGGAGDDEVETRLGDDTAFGGEGNDTLRSSSGNAQMFGDDGDDTLLGRSGSDTLDGGSGIDFLVGGLGLPDDTVAPDTLIGGTGDDTFFVDGGETLVEDLDGGTDLVWAAINWTLGDNLENFLAQTGDASIDGHGNALDNSMVGNSGINTLIGKEGDDFIDGEAGDDRLEGQEGDDRLYGGEGDDLIYGGNDKDTAFGGNDNDVIFGGDQTVIKTISVLSPDDVDVSQIDEAGEVSDPIDPGRFDADSNTIKMPFLGNLPDGGGALFRVDNGTSETRSFEINPPGSGPNIPVPNVPPGTSVVVNVGNIFGGFSLEENGVKVAGVSSSNPNSLVNVKVESDSDDSLYGDIGDDTLHGELGDDSLFGGEDDDTLFAGLGDDLGFGGSGSDQLFGGDEGVEKTISVLSPNDVDVSQIDAKGEVSDPIVPGRFDANSNTIKMPFLGNLPNSGGALFRIDNGTTETQTFEVNPPGAGANLVVADVPPGSSVVINVGNVFGGFSLELDGQKVAGVSSSNPGRVVTVNVDADGNDTLGGDEDDDRLHGEQGDDSLYGGDDNDLLYGGDGNDTIAGDSDIGDLVPPVKTISVLSPDDVDVSQIEAAGDASDPIDPGRFDADSNTIKMPFLGNLPDGGGALFRVDNGTTETRSFEINPPGSAQNIPVLDVPPGTSVVVNVGNIFGGFSLEENGIKVAGVSTSNPNTEVTVKVDGPEPNDNSGSDTAYGGAGNDYILGEGGSDSLFGGDGNDVIHGGGNSEVMQFISVLSPNDVDVSQIDAAGDASDPIDPGRFDENSNTIKMPFLGNLPDGGGALFRVDNGTSETRSFEINPPGSGPNIPVLDVPPGTSVVVNVGSVFGGFSLEENGVKVAGVSSSNPNTEVTVNSEDGGVGDEGDLIEGGAGDDELFGELGDDSLYGGAGDDDLLGGFGDDSLFGGADNGSFEASIYQAISVLSPNDVRVSQIEAKGDVSDPIDPGRFDENSNKISMPFLGNLPDGGGALFRVDNGTSETSTFEINPPGSGPNIPVPNVPPGTSVVVNVGNVFGGYSLELDGEKVAGVSSANASTEKSVNEALEIDALVVGDEISGGKGEDVAEYFVFDGNTPSGGVDEVAGDVESLVVHTTDDYEAQVISGALGDDRELVVFVDKADGTLLADHAIIFEEDDTNISFVI
ncbi:MAG: hypothetical protein Kilf2KO_35090 [Rhodospirillales bacterium]